MTLLQINGLEKRYTSKQALNGVDMTLESGRIVGLLGPNASGKTTLLKTIAGLLVPDSGSITYPGDARGVDARRAVALMPDTMKFPSWMRVRDAFLFYEDMYPDFSPERARELKALLELTDGDRIRRLSKGMQERVALGLTFSRETSLYLLDEPLGGIDPVGKSKVLDSILSMELDDSTILLSTHLVKDVERIFDSVFFLSDGKIIFSGDCEEMRADLGRTVEQTYMEVFANVKTV